MQHDYSEMLYELQAERKRGGHSDSSAHAQHPPRPLATSHPPMDANVVALPTAALSTHGRLPAGPMTPQTVLGRTSVLVGKSTEIDYQVPVIVAHQPAALAHATVQFKPIAETTTALRMLWPGADTASAFTSLSPPGSPSAGPATVKHTPSSRRQVITTPVDTVAVNRTLSASSLRFRRFFSFFFSASVFSAKIVSLLKGRPIITASRSFFRLSASCMCFYIRPRHHTMDANEIMFPSVFDNCGFCTHRLRSRFNFSLSETLPLPPASPRPPTPKLKRVSASRSTTTVVPSILLEAPSEPAESPVPEDVDVFAEHADEVEALFLDHTALGRLSPSSHADALMNLAAGGHDLRALLSSSLSQRSATTTPLPLAKEAYLIPDATTMDLGSLANMIWFEMMQQSNGIPNADEYFARGRGRNPLRRSGVSACASSVEQLEAEFSTTAVPIGAVEALQEVADKQVGKKGTKGRKKSSTGLDEEEDEEDDFQRRAREAAAKASAELAAKADPRAQRLLDAMNAFVLDVASAADDPTAKGKKGGADSADTDETAGSGRGRSGRGRSGRGSKTPQSGRASAEKRLTPVSRALSAELRRKAEADAKAEADRLKREAKAQAKADEDDGDEDGEGQEESSSEEEEPAKPSRPVSAVYVQKFSPTNEGWRAQVVVPPSPLNYVAPPKGDEPATASSPSRNGIVPPTTMPRSLSASASITLAHPPMSATHAIAPFGAHATMSPTSPRLPFPMSLTAAYQPPLPFSCVV
jgi:hypothetical protein